MQYLKIPLERMAVLIGEKGSVKRDVEKRTGTKITVEGACVTIDNAGEDAIGELTAKNIVQAIGRGFSPDVAFQLTRDDSTIEVITLKDYANTPKSFERLKSRVIGEKGKCRKNIEELSGAYISVYGKTVTIIGSFDEVAVAKEAVLKLIGGARHSSVYRFLEKTRVQRRHEPWSGEFPKT